MRYLVFGDVHGNLLALTAVLAAGDARGVEGYLFVGDLVGYGPDPIGCIEVLARLQAAGTLAWVAGNHDRVARGEINPDGFSEEATSTLAWTGQLLAEHRAAREFLAAGHLSVEANQGIWLTHDSLADPGSVGYHRWPQNAKSELACLRFYKGRVAFYGHTHAVRVEVFSEARGLVLVPLAMHEGDERDPRPVRFGADELGWVGVGSVGFPTNPLRQPEFMILDDATWTLEKYVVTYPREKIRARVREVLTPVCGAAVAQRIEHWL